MATYKRIAPKLKVKGEAKPQQEGFKLEWTERVGQHSVQLVSCGHTLLMDEILDENYETCHEDLEDTLDASIVSVDELSNTLNSSNDMNVRK